MKILCCTPWRNTWIPYWTKFFESHGHEVRWHINDKLIREEIMADVGWSDKVLSMWADKYAIMLSNECNKDLYVILRSYEIFSVTGWSDLALIKWDKVKQLFMLNEAHAYPFSCRIRGVVPMYIKNGVDLDEWKFVDKTSLDTNKMAYICDINEKKGVELCFQAVRELQKDRPDITMEHIGRNQDLRRWYYLEHIMPELNLKWESLGYNNSHGFVQEFLKDKKWIICSSVAEGHPMNIIEAMACGVKPLVHNYPGAKAQFPSELIWTTFDQFKEVLKNDYDGARCRKYAEENFDYRETYKPVLKVMER